MTDRYRIDQPVTITLIPIEGAAQRIHLQPTDEPGVELRIERQTWRGCNWHTTGVEYIEHVDISGFLSSNETSPNPVDEGGSRDS